MSPSAPPESTATGLPTESRWQVGTLAYTRRGLVRLFSWLLWGDLAWSIRDRSIGPVLQLLLKQFQASDTLAGLLSGTFPAIIGLFLGPVISFRSDRHRGPRGRRLPFLLISAPVAALSTLGLGYSPILGGALHRALGTHSPGLFPAVLIVLAVWWIVFDFATTVTNAIFGALINDVVPHLVIGRFYGLFRTVSLLVGIAFNYYLLEKAEAHYQWMFTAVGLIYGVGVVLMCLQLREGEYPPAPPAEGSGLGRFFSSVRDYFRQCFSQPYYLWYFAASNLGLLATAPVNLYTVFFVKSVGMSVGTYGKYLAATYAASLCLSYGLGVLADRLHPLRLGMAAITLYGLAALWGGVFATTQGTFGAALLAHGVLSGTYYTVSASLGQRLLPKDSFAQLASAGGLIGAGCNILLPLILGSCLDRSGHNYRLTFYAGSALSLAALGCYAVLYRLWRQRAAAAELSAR